MFSVEQCVREALKEEVRIWQNNMKGNIRVLELPPLPQNDPIIASAIWYNFGLDAGKNLSAVVAATVNKAALPIWLTFKAQELYASHYREKQSDSYAMLSTHYQRFKSQLIDSIDDAERRFFVQPFAREVHTCICELYKNSQFNRETELIDNLRVLIRESKVIVTSDETIRALIQKNLNKVAQGIIDIYQGSAQAGRNKILYVSNKLPLSVQAKNSRQAQLLGSRSAASDSCSGYGVQRQVPAGYRQVDTTDRQGMAELYANAHKFEITHKDFLTIEPCMDTSYVRERTMSQPSVSSLLTASLRGTKKSLVDTYNQLNSSSAPRAVGL